MIEHIAPMDGALIDAAPQRQLGEDHVQHAQRVHPPHGRRRAVVAEHPLELGPDALGGDRREVGGPPPRLRFGLRRHAQVVRRLEAHGAQHPQRIFRQRLRRGKAQPAGHEIGASIQRIDDAALHIARQKLVQRRGHRVDREVAALQVGLQIAVEIGDIDPAVLNRQPPGDGAFADSRRAHAQTVRRGRRPLFRAARDDVHLGHVNAQQRVAQRAADRVRLGLRVQRRNSPQRRFKRRHRRPHPARAAARAAPARPRDRCKPAR